MLWLIDTNILVSAALFPASVPAQAFMQAVSYPHHAVICDYTLEEMWTVYKRKFPHKIAVFENFMASLMQSTDIIAVPAAAIHAEVVEKVRDKKDWPILMAAIFANVDGIITGDKDLLESGIAKLDILSPAEFVRIYCQQ